MFRLLSTIDFSTKAPDVDGGILFVNDRESGDPMLIPCEDVEDVFPADRIERMACTSIALRNGETVTADHEPAGIREMWLAWATDNLRFTTEVARGK